MSEVTIVIPNYNGLKYLPGCLDSLLPEVQRARVSYEVLVVDDGSADGSREFLEMRYPRVRCIFLEENGGFCRAVNAGIRASESPYILLLNNDTKAFPGFVQRMYDAISGRRRCFSVSASMRMWDWEEKLDGAGDLYSALGWSRARGKGRYASGYARRCRIFSACGGAAIYRRSVLEEIGLFDELHFAYLEDLDIGWRAQIFGYYNLYEPRAAILHYGSATTGSRYNERKIALSSANNVYVIAKNMPAVQICLNLPLLLLGFGIKALFFARRGYGRVYIRGLFTGLKRSLSREGRARRVRFAPAHISSYLRIQAQLWGNCFRMSVR